MEEKSAESMSIKKELSSSHLENLYKKHVRGSYFRISASLAMWLIFVLSRLLGAIDRSAFIGMSLGALFLIVMNPPTLWIIKRIKSRRFYEINSIFINILELFAYTSIMYFAGGLRAGYMILLYAAVISYIGVAAPRRSTILISIVAIFIFNFMVIAEHIGILPHSNLHGQYLYNWGDIIGYCLIINALFGVVAYGATSTGMILRKNRNNLRMKNIELDRSRQEVAIAKEKVEGHAKRLNSINKIATLVNRSLNLDDILQSVCEELTKIFPIRNAWIGLIDPTNKILRVSAFHSKKHTKTKFKNISIPMVKNPAFLKILESREPNIVNEKIELDTKVLEKDFSKNYAMIVTPLVSRGNSLGLLVGSMVNSKYQIRPNDFDLSRAIASQVAASIDNAKLHSQTESALNVAEGDLEMGRQIQSGFLPDTIPHVKGWEFASYFVAARQVAGDFYDVFPIGEDGKTGLVIGDVCDKGVGAALFMAVFRSLIRAFSEVEDQTVKTEQFLLGIVKKINTYISTAHGSSDMFATTFFGILEPKNNTLFYINAGHEWPLIIGIDGKIKNTLMKTGPAIGLFDYLEFKVEKVVFEPGDILITYTDGVVDARNVQGAFLGKNEFLSQISQPFSSALSLIKSVEIKVNSHIGSTPQFDDITMLVLRRKLTADDNIHKIMMEAKIENLPTLMDFVEKACDVSTINKKVTFAFKLSVDEACTNIINHGYKNLKPGLIDLTFQTKQNEAVLSIHDNGRSFDPKQSVDVASNVDLEDRELGGLGLVLIKEMADDIQYKSDPEKGNELILSKKIIKSL